MIFLDYLVCTRTESSMTSENIEKEQQSQPSLHAVEELQPSLDSHLSDLF